MKNMKVTALIFAVLLLFSFTVGAYTVEKNGTKFEVDTEKHTIFDGTHTYEYEFSGNSSDYTVDITYPDGSSYWWKMSGSSGYGGWSEDYNTDKYADGGMLCDVLLENVPKAPSAKKVGNIFVSIILVLLGIFSIAAPETVWYLEHGWRYKDAEPSDLALGMNRVGGVVEIIVAIILLFV